MKSLLVFGMTTLILAGCAVFGGSRDRALRSNPSFREGYEDGCAAATDQGADLRDRPVDNPQLYKSDDIYRAGWSNGYQTCRRSDQTPGAAPANGAISLPGPGH
jgi:hypothetical protein